MGTFTVSSGQAWYYAPGFFSSIGNDLYKYEFTNGVVTM